MEAIFEFEKPILTLEKKLSELRELNKSGGINLQSEITALQSKLSELIESTYSQLTAWQRVQLSRHPQRPYTRDYVDLIFTDFIEIHGDRRFGEDQALLAGTAKLGDLGYVAILGHQKGRSTQQRMERNFGMVRPEGYRKGIRLMELANRFKMPLITFIDTPGAYPGIDAEERGQSQAIAESIRTSFTLDIPIVSIVIGEGGSGGALAIGVADRVLMQEYAIYSVISPESCAAILWNDASHAEFAADQMKLHAKELKRMGIIDRIVPEPAGGAQRNWKEAADLLTQVLKAELSELQKSAAKPQKKGKSKSDSPHFLASRAEKFRAMGAAALAQSELTSTP